MMCALCGVLAGAPLLVPSAPFTPLRFPGFLPQVTAGPGVLNLKTVMEFYGSYNSAF
jgi:hypothetical protein